MPRKQLDNRVRAFLLTFIVLGVLAVVAIIGLGKLSHFDQEPNQSPRSASPGFDSQSRPVASAQTQLSPSRAAKFEATTSSSVLKHFVPERVLGNPECRMTVYPSVLGDTAVVVLPTEDGARFAVLDAGGPLFAGELPFRPRRFQVVRRRDGSVLTAFTDTSHLLLDDRSTERRGFARVHLDRQPILVHDMVSDLELAPDGSSYFFVEPLAADTSQMVIHNLDLGLERTHFLDTLYYSPPSSHRYYSGYYSRDNSEIMFFPDYEGVGKHRFLPTGPSGGWRIVDVTDIEGLQTAAFTSSEAGFFLTYDQEEMRGEVFRRDFEWDGPAWQSVDRWSVTLPESVGFNLPMQFSSDGSMLLAHGKEMRLIDTDDGEVLFRFPLRDKSAQLSRLAHILGPDATEADVGNGEWPFFRGEQLLLPREFEGAEGGKARRVYDVFDLAEMSINAGPDVRVADNREVCAPSERGQPGLREEGGRLVYRFGG